MGGFGAIDVVPGSIWRDSKRLANVCVARVGIVEIELELVVIYDVSGRTFVLPMRDFLNGRFAKL